MAGKSGASQQALPVPKGGGATRGLGDGFTPDFNRGTGSYSVDIEVPKGHRDLKPTLSLTYNTAAGNGPFGLGWSLSLPRIQLDTDTGVPDYHAPAYLFGGETLVDTGEGQFRPRVENAFHRIQRDDQGGWAVTDKSGMTTRYGATPESRITGRVAGEEQPFAWLPEAARDTSGNEIRYTYRRDGGNLYLDRVTYASFEVRFHYDQRPDPTVDRRAGFAIETRLRCTRIDVRRPAADHPLIRRYHLDYQPGTDRPSLLETVQVEGFKRGPDGAVSAKRGPALSLGYTAFDPATRTYEAVAEDAIEPPGPLGDGGRELVDLYGNGLPDVVQLGQGRPRVWQNRGGGRFAPPAPLDALPETVGIDNAKATFFDIDGTGSADLTYVSARNTHYYPNGSPSFNGHHHTNGSAHADGNGGGFGRPRRLGARAPVDVDLADPNVRFADVNGDGRVDLARSTAQALLFWRNQGGDDGFEGPAVVSRKRDRDAFPDISFADPGVFFADMTGDGLPDIVHVDRGFVEYWPSLGYGRFDRRVVMADAPLLPRHFDPERLFLADVDGSGTTDVVYVGPGRVRVWRNLGGQRFAEAIEIAGVPRTARAPVRLVDLRGEGTAGVLWGGVRARRGAGWRYLSLGDTKPYLLTTIDDGVGLRTRIKYGTSAQHAARDLRDGRPWQTRLPMPVHVIDRISRVDQVTGAEDTTEMHYHNGVWDTSTRRFRGFSHVDARRLGDDDVPESREEHHYLVGAPDEPALGNGFAPSLRRARRGQEYRAVYQSPDPDEEPLRTESVQWQVEVAETAPDGTPILFPQVTATVVRNAEGGEHPRVTTAQYTYDVFGNVTEERRTGTAPSGDDEGRPVEPLEAITRMEYATNTDTYVVDRVARTTKHDADGNLLAEVRHYYDGPAFEGLPLGEVEKGLPSRQEEAVLTKAKADAVYGADAVDWEALGYHPITRADGAEAWAVDQTRVSFNARGLPEERRDAQRTSTRFVYDDEDLLIVEVHSAEGHVTRASYDRGWQLIEERTNARGATTRYAYDGLGRVHKVVRPGDSLDFPTLQYVHQDENLPFGVHTRKRRTAGTEETYEEATYYDGFGRSLQERSRVDGDTVRVDGATSYNRRGDAVRKGLPRLSTGLDFEPPPDPSPETPAFRYAHDALGRVVSAFELEGRKMDVSYTPWRALIYDVTDTDSSHRHHDTPRIQHFDPFGRLVGVSVSSAPDTTHRATYSYDLLGRLLQKTDLEGRPTLKSATYDGRGARLRLEHATAGTRTVVYDALGRAVRYWDDREQTVERTYDARDRIVSVAVEGEVQETYHWDQTPEQMGLLGRVDDAAGSVTFDYDPRGRVTGKTRQILGTTYALEYGYDAAGMQNRQVYPDGSAVDFTRWDDGRVQSVSGFVDEASYDDHGRITALQHTNGVEETFSYGPAGNLTVLKVRRDDEMLRHARMKHDALGQTTRIEELVGPHDGVEEYTFDALGHLRTFTEQSSGTSDTYQYDFDADGNLLRADDMDAEAFEYDFTRPGALQRRKRPNGEVDSFDFDAAGHLQSTDDMALEFDARERLIRVTRADGTVVEMTYDYRGARVAKQVTGPAGSYDVRYVDDLYEERAGVASAYVYMSGRLVGQRRGSGRRHLHPDRRGSTVLTTKTNGRVDERAWFGPFGEGATMPNDEVSRQFTGTIFDPETGLYYFNHRFYSPAMGRFLSPDPRFLAEMERELDQPEAHNLFAYANGNPVDYVDPIGLQGFWSDLGQVLGAIVVVAAVAVAITVAAVVIAGAMAAGGWAVVLGAAAAGAIIGGIEGGWEGALVGAMIGFTAGINFMLAGPLGIITFLGVFDGVREQDWYKSLAGWSSWLMPASWPGHIMGLGIFLANGIAHLFGSSDQIESVRFDWEHGQILTAGGAYGGSPLPWLNVGNAPAHNVGGFSFFSNNLWTASGGNWAGMQATIEHETGHMISNAIFGFWQSINIVENITTPNHNDRFFERIAESNVNAADRDAYGNIVPVYH